MRFIGKEYTAKEIADKMGVTVQRVSQFRRGAIKNTKHKMFYYPPLLTINQDYYYESPRKIKYTIFGVRKIKEFMKHKEKVYVEERERAIRAAHAALHRKKIARNER